MKLKAIVCVDNNWGIGKDNKLLFHIPQDMEFFKRMTTDHIVIMGNNTFKSIKEKPLPKRKNIVITSDITRGMMFISPNLIKMEPSVLFHYLESSTKEDEEVFIIGGESIYHKYIDLCDEVYITRVSASREADTFFPNLNEKNNFELHAIYNIGTHVETDSDGNEIDRYQYAFMKWIKVDD